MMFFSREFLTQANNIKTNNLSVSVSNYTTWYIDKSGNLYGCGLNGQGQQGSGDTTNVLTFTKRIEEIL